MAGNDFFHELHVTFYWSEYDLYDLHGLPYEENQEFQGTQAYEFLCQLISADKEAWNNKLLGQGYWKTNVSISLKDYDFTSFRVDLGDTEFGNHETVADSLRDLLGKYISSYGESDNLDALKGFHAVMDDFAKEEALYLPNHPELQDRLGVRLNTFLYCISPEDWKEIPDLVRTFHKPIDLPIEDKMYFFSKQLPADAVFVRSTRDPDDRMERYGENRLQLLIPKKEQEYLDDFQENFVVEEQFFSRFSAPSDFKATGIRALSYVCKLMREDFNAFSDAVETKCFIPNARYNLRISFHGNELASLSYLKGKGDCMRQLSDMFSGLCKSDPDFKDQLITLCKYNRRDVYHMELLLDGLHPVSAKVLEQFLPDDKTSLNTLLQRKPELPTEDMSSYYCIEYMRYISNVVLVKASMSNMTDIPVLVARELASDNFGLRSAKPLVKGFFNYNDFVDKVLEAYRKDKEVKQILKANKSRDMASFEKQKMQENNQFQGR